MAPLVLAVALALALAPERVRQDTSVRSCSWLEEGATQSIITCKTWLGFVPFARTYIL